MTDPIADMLTRIRNAQSVNKTEVLLPFSGLKQAIAEILQREGYLRKVERVEGTGADAKRPQLRLVLKYLAPKQPAIRSLVRISRPGRRVYATKDQLPVVLNNLGLAVISTSQGLMTNKQARKAGLGGEIICEIN